MEQLIIGALIGIVCIFLGMFYVNYNENQKKKALLQQIITRALVELNENRDFLKQLLSLLKPGNKIVESDLDKAFNTLLELNPPVLKSDELNQLKTAGEFINYVDIKTNVETNNLLTRFRYVNKFTGENKSLTAFSKEEYKTLYHTYEMTETLIDTLSEVLNKIKG